MNMPINTESNKRKLSWESKVALCHEWKKSGGTKSEFCRKHDLTISAFYSWCDKLWPKDRKIKSKLTPVRIIELDSIKNHQQMHDGQINLKLLLPNATMHMTLPMTSAITFIKELCDAVAVIR
ncbi:MAG: hypothetical protein WC748_10420 [Legionellales bacterium]|jgi:transposase-like protein